MNSETIEKVGEINFLGLTFDENLNWEPHVQKISNKLARTLGIMCGLRMFFTNPDWHGVSKWSFKKICKNAQYVSFLVANIIPTLIQYLKN